MGWTSAVRLALAAAAFFTVTSVAVAEAPLRTAPTHLSQQRLAAIGRYVEADIAKGLIPGAQLLIVKDGKPVLQQRWGELDPQAKTAMPPDAIFRIYSMTKPITTVTAMMLVEEGKLALEQPVAKYIPAFKDVKVGIEKKGADGRTTLELVAPRRPITIQDLMRHTSGLTYGIFGESAVKKAYRDADLFAGDPDNAEFAQRIAALPLAYQPGTTWEYSHATDILGRVIEVVEGKPLYAVMKERLFDPLAMRDTSFYVTDKAKQDRIAEPFAKDRAIGTGASIGDPRIERRWQSGGGGLVSTTADYARFLLMLRNGGSLDGKRYLGPKTIAFMTANHIGPGSGVVAGPLYIPGPGFGFGLGFAVRLETGVAPYEGSVGEANWGGVGGTAFWLDPKEDIFVVFMMQSPSQRVRYRAVLRNIIYSALEP